MRRMVLFLLAASLCLSLPAYGMSPEEARAKLGHLGLPFTGETFVGKVQSGHRLIIQWFLEAGIDVNAKDSVGRTALMTAPCLHKEIFWKLLGRGADVNIKDNYGKTVLMRIVTARYAQATREMFQGIMAHGADVDAKDIQGRTALMWAAYNGNSLWTEALLDKGADVNLRDYRGNTALDLAEMKRRIERREKDKGYNDVVKMLRQAGAK